MSTYIELEKLSLEDKVKYYLTKGWYGVIFGRHDKEFREKQIDNFKIIFTDNMDEVRYFEIKNNTLYINKKYIYDAKTLGNNAGEKCINSYLDQIDNAFSKWLKAKQESQDLNFYYADNIIQSLNNIREIQEKIKIRQLGGKTFKNSKYLEKQIRKDFFYVDYFNIRVLNNIIEINICDKESNCIVDNLSVVLSDNKKSVLLIMNWDIWKNKLHYDKFKFKFIDKLKHIINDNNIII